jgi:cytochrome c biogenesis protein CcdA
VLALLVIPFILGVVRGSTICMIACAPGIIPYLIMKKYDWRKCLRLAILFNLPRIFVLSILGILVGILGFYLKELITSYLTNFFIPAQSLGYGLLGFFIFFFGAYMFMTSIDKKEDMKDWEDSKIKCQNRKNVKKRKLKNKKLCAESDSCINNPIPEERSGILSFIRTKFRDIQNQPENLFLLWGGLLSLACLGEIILVELSIISGSFGLMSNSVTDAAILGGTAMFLFSIGAALPIIIVATISNPIRVRFVDTIEKLESMRTIFGIVMIIVGLWFIIVLFTYIASLFFG